MLTNLKRLREKAGVTQKRLAEAIGISQQSINKYENHSIEPDIDTMIRIAAYFNTTVDFLIGYSNDTCGAEVGLTNEEEQLIKGYRKLTKKQRAVIKSAVDSYIDEK